MGIVTSVAGPPDEDAIVGPITEGARPVAASVARNVNVVGPVAVGAGSVAAAAGRDASVGAITEDGELVAGLADNATKLSQTGHIFSVRRGILGSTRARM